MEDKDLLQAHPLPYRVYPGNRIIVTVGQKKTLLRWTPDQYRRYMVMQEARRRKFDEETKKVTNQEVLEIVRVDRYDVLEIVFNPDRDKVEFSREELEAAFDHNHAGHIAQIWLQELLTPELHPNDPARGPALV
jgi:hypothetical protein